MIEIVFELAGEVVVTKLDGVGVFFSTGQTGFEVAVPIDLIKFDLAGIVREFPDLKGMEPDAMRIEALARFKEKIRDLETEEMRKRYIIKEFTKMGYTLKLVNREGFRPTTY